MRLSLNDLLRATSRSFYLTLRVLPAPVREQIGLAYLLARTTDTIADTEIIPVAERLAALASLRDRILSRSSALLDFRKFAGNENAGATAAERVLLLRVEDALAVLASFSTEDRARIAQVLDVITSGQELDLRRFAGAGAGNVIALADAAALDDYTYRVAGCVGEFWTKMCRAHLFPSSPLDDAALLRDGVRFGKGLQLVNILRDLPKDLSIGRCYLPESELQAAGLKPADLLDPRNESRLRPVYDRWLARAEQHLAAAWDYTNALPRAQIRLRLACAWPVLIGLQTLRRLHEPGVLDPAKRIKISRADVRAIIFKTILRLPSETAWRKLAEPLPPRGDE
jgi:farnesyl-diphosphate farnesyltransferase